MAPDQTIRVMEDKLKFAMEIFYRFEVLRLYSFLKGWKSPTFQSFPIIIPLYMKIPDV